MSVYTHSPFPCLQNPNWRFNKVSHLIADTEAELHEFAGRLSLKRSWFQDTNHPHHYDLSPGMFHRAVKLGVTLLELRPYVKKGQYIRQEELRREVKGLPEMVDGWYP